jgi:hypothetical protein
MGAASEKRRTDALGFLLTAFTVLAWNAIAAVLLGCSIYLLRYVWSLRSVPVGSREAEATH